MFWGYSPAVDLLREYFSAQSDDGSPRDGGCTPDKNKLRRSVVTEITEISDEETAPTEQGSVRAPEGSSHVQEDDPADDAGGRVVGRLPPDGYDGGAEQPPEQEQAGQDGGGAAAQLQRHGVAGPAGPLQVADAAHGGRHVHHHGAVDVQPAGHGDHAVRPDGQVGLPAPTAAHCPGDADCGEEVVATPAAPAADSDGVGPAQVSSLPCGAFNYKPDDIPGRTAKRNSFLARPGLFDVAPPSGTSGRDDSVGVRGVRCVRVLLLGGLDGRHVLKTLGRLHRHRTTRVRLYVADAVMEVVARQLVFLLAALEPPERMGLTEKVRLLMELLGNTLVRPSTARWLRHAARLLVDLVTNPELLARRLPVVDLSHLRHQDRNRLEEILAFYQERPQGFRIGHHWDQRLRKHLKTRYDSRAGAYDWDYFMGMRELPGGDKVCVHEYRHWRETGVAFTWLEGEQAEPNLSMGAGIFREGQHLLHGGYLGDIVTSPYIAYAIQLEEEDAAEVFRKANDQYVARSTDATERHLSRILYELQHGHTYTPPKDVDGRGTGILLSRVTDASRLDPEAPADEEDPSLRGVRQAADMMSYAALPVPDAEVVFLSPKFLRPEGRHAHRSHFHVVFLGRGLAEQHLNSDLVRVLAPGALVLVEGTRFLLERRDARDQYATLLAERARAAGLSPLGDFHPDQDDFAKFVISDH